MRELLISFWQLKYHSLTVGTQEKVPCVNMNWKAVGRVIVYGAKRCNYFPIVLISSCYSICLIWRGQYLRQFLSGIIFTVCNTRVKGDYSYCTGCNKFHPNDGDLLDFLSNFKCFTKVTAGNILQVIHEFTCQELLQKPRYFMDCFAPIVSVLRASPAFQNLQQIYLEKKLTPKKIIKLVLSP